MTLITFWGWSAVTFDGTVGSPVVPRTTSTKKFHFGEEDSRMVNALRDWAASASDSPVPPEPTVHLSAVVPRQYFNLTCQLLTKASMDSACTLLKVCCTQKHTKNTQRCFHQPGFLFFFYSV